MPTTSTDPRAAAAALLVPGATCHGFAVERCETAVSYTHLGLLQELGSQVVSQMGGDDTRCKVNHLSLIHI